MKKKVYCYELDLDIMPHFIERIKVICSRHSNLMIVNQDDEMNQYTYIGLNPKEYIYTQDKALNIVNKTQFLTKRDDYLRHIIEWLNRNEIIVEKPLPPFFGGAMGFINDSLDDYYRNKTNLCDIPELCFMIFDDLITIDYKSHQIVFTYIGDLNQDEYYEFKYRQFIKEIDRIEVKEPEKSYASLIFNENEILEKFNKISAKFNEEKYYIIKNAEKVIIDTNLTPLDIFLRMMTSKIYSTCSYFKTSDFSLMVHSNHQDLIYMNNHLTLTYGKKHNSIIKEMNINQVYQLINKTNLIIDEYDGYSKIQAKLKTNIYDFLYHFILNHSDYGIPFERVQSYIRRTESEYRLNGLIGLIGYNNHFIGSQIIEPMIFDRNEHYLNIETYHTHLSTGTDYINEIINHVNHYLEVLD